MYRNNTVMLNLTAFSLLCLMILIGGFFYSGSILPVTVGEDPGRALVTWALWFLIVAIPALTGVLWVMQLFKRST